MKHHPNTRNPRPLVTRVAVAQLAVLLAAAGGSAYGQGLLASGTLTASGAGPYSYSLSFSDDPSATSPIGSVWYAWVPGQFYLPGIPTSTSAPSGWTATVSGNSVQYVATSSANYIQPGQSLSGFGYQATFTPAQLAAAPNSGVSDAYSAGLFSDGGYIFTVQMVPEPGTALLLVPPVLWLAARRRRRRSLRRS